MGVSGSGKSSVAAALAERFRLALLEADDLHPPENRARMAAGMPLTDAMRDPWIDRICAALRLRFEQGEDCVLACSALRKAHRLRIRSQGFVTLFLHLQGDRHLIAGRLQERRGHYFPAGLLDSQFLDLEPTADEPDVIALDIGPGLPTVVAASVEAVRALLQRNVYGEAV
jgi:gluconokinase